MYSCKTLIVTEKEFPTSEKRLSICLGPNGFSFSELTLSGALLTFGEAEGAHASSMTVVMNEVKTLLSSVGIRPLGYASMELVVFSDESVWVPDELYSAASNRQYLKLVGSHAASIMASSCRALSSTAVFAAPDTLVTAFKVALPGLTVLNQHVKIASLGLEKRSTTHPLLLTHWHGKAIDFAAFREGRYIFGNTIHVENDREAQYHTIEVIKSFGLENADTELLLCGEVGRERFALLSPYFPTASLFTGIHTSYLNPAFKTLHTYKNALIL